MAEKVRPVVRARRARVAGYGAVCFVAVVVFVALAVMPARQAAVIESVLVPGEMRACRADADCVYVETTCSSCCGYVGINRAFEQAFYEQLYAPACEGYGGAVCECIALHVVAVCRQGLCELTDPRDSGSD